MKKENSHIRVVSQMSDPFFPSNNVESINGKAEIEIDSISNVKSKEIEWLWKDVLAFKKMTLVAGEPGVGKSQLLLYIASVISNGKNFKHDSKPCPMGKVLLIAGEDTPEDTIKPRLLALGANLDNIHFVKGIKKFDANGHEFYDPICLIDNLSALEKKIIEHEYKLIIVDPISLYLGSVDENKNKEIRSALSVINALAERRNLAVLLNSHFSKPSGNTQKNAVYRVMGSIGFAAAARIVFGVMKDPEDPSRRLFIPIKNNIGQDKIGYVYKIKSEFVENNIATSRIEWLEEKIEKTANEVLNSLSPTDSPKLEEVKVFLQEMLKSGSIALSVIRRESDIRGFSANRLYKAKDELNIYENMSFGAKRGKIWSLPS